jgi:hypothetical protein
LEKDNESGNPLARAMARISLYQGNTVLESGNFQLRKEEGMVYVVKRSSVVVLGGIDKGRFGREEEGYVVKCGEWRGLCPPMVKGREYDCWWARLHVSVDVDRRTENGELMCGCVEPFPRELRSSIFPCKGSD